MKKFIYCLFFVASLSHAQNISPIYYQINSSPDANNSLSKYFKKHIPSKQLERVSYYKNKKNIVVSFNINNNNEIFNIHTGIGSTALRTLIENSFKKIPFDKLNLQNPDPSSRYSFQIITKKKNKNVIECSSKLIEEKVPLCTNCEMYDNFVDREKCLTSEVKKHFQNNFNFNLLPRNNTEVEKSSLSISFHIDKNKNYKYKKNKKHSNVLKEEINRVFKELPLVNSFTLLDENYISKNYSISLNKPSEDSIPKKEVVKLLDIRELAMHFSNTLKEESLNMAELNLMNPGVRVSFQLDQKKKYTYINAYSRSNKLNHEIAEALQRFPVEKLKLPDSHKFNVYSFELLDFVNNNLTIIKDPNLIYERVPIYKGCEKSKDPIEAKKCFNQKIAQHISRKFNAKLANELNLPSGTARILVMFKISDKQITDIKVKAPHEDLKEEAIRVIKSIPKLAASGVQNGKEVPVSYSLPIAFYVK